MDCAGGKGDVMAFFQWPNANRSEPIRVSLHGETYVDEVDLPGNSTSSNAATILDSR